jgi:hypothetical protein
MNNASSTGAIRFIALPGAKALSAIDASAMSHSGIPAHDMQIDLTPGALRLPSLARSIAFSFGFKGGSTPHQILNSGGLIELVQGAPVFP